jgi:hypothetical protein
MAQINKGTTYSTGDQVTAANLNALVDNAFLTSGAVNEQPQTSVISGSDKTLLAQGNSLRSVTLELLKASITPDITSFLNKDGSIPVNTGVQLTLGTTNQISALDAVSKGYVDATSLPLAGGTLTGNLTLTTAGIVTLSKDPVGALEAVTKQYVDARSLKCSGYFSSTTVLNPPSNILDESKFLSCQGSRSAGSGILTINFSSLDARYKSSTVPFFLAGQYVGIKTVSGVTAHLYKIISVDYTNSTFVITTPETTVFSGAVQLSCVYDNSLNTDVNTFNCKSVYLCYASNKHYVNYWNDTVTGLKTNTNPTEFFNTVVTGQSNTYNYNVLNCRLMINLFQRNSWQFSGDVPEGFGSFSTGCHIGYFYNEANGSDYAYQYRATFLIT